MYRTHLITGIGLLTLILAAQANADEDLCPDTDATGYDEDGDGCIDDLDGNGVGDSLDQDLVAYYPFDGDTSDVINGDNASGGDVSFLDGQCSSTAAFDGDTQLGLPEHPLDSFSVALWYQDFSDFTVLESRLWEFGSFDSDGGISVNVGKFSALSATIVDADGNSYTNTTIGTTGPTDWTHLVVTYDYDATGAGEGLKYFLNGIEIPRSTLGSDFNEESTADWTDVRWRLAGPVVSEVGGISRFKGYIDDVRIYDRVLTDDEIEDLADTAIGCGGDWTIGGNDADNDGVPDSEDVCPGGNDTIDNNGDGEPDCVPPDPSAFKHMSGTVDYTCTDRSAGTTDWDFSYEVTDAIADFEAVNQKSIIRRTASYTGVGTTLRVGDSYSQTDAESSFTTVDGTESGVTTDSATLSLSSGALSITASGGDFVTVDVDTEEETTLWNLAEDVDISLAWSENGATCTGTGALGAFTSTADTLADLDGWDLTVLDDNLSVVTIDSVFLSPNLSSLSVSVPSETTVSDVVSMKIGVDINLNDYLEVDGLDLPDGETKSIQIAGVPGVSDDRDAYYSATYRGCVVDAPAGSFTQPETEVACSQAGGLEVRYTTFARIARGQPGTITRMHMRSGLNSEQLAVPDFGSALGTSLFGYTAVATPQLGDAATISVGGHNIAYSTVESVEFDLQGLSNTTVVMFRDTDGDGLPDGDEALHGTDPDIADTDGDGVLDRDEVDMGTDPLDADDYADPDADGDGLGYGDEDDLGTDPDLADTDSDGVDDFQEVIDGTDPLDGNDSLFSDTDGDGVDDRRQDTDGDRLDDGTEASLGTDPDLADTDGDGVDDFAELYIYNTDPLDSADVDSADTDGDGLDDHNDNCILVDDVDQTNTDGDLFGDVCDDDDDNDGVADDDDECALDPDKTAPGDCGCGESDSDSDSDGTADCLEDELTLDGEKSHVRWHDTKYRSKHDLYKNMSWASFTGTMELGGGLLAPDFRDDSGEGSGLIEVLFGSTDPVTVYSSSISYTVADYCNSDTSDNREKWTYKDHILNEDGKKYQSKEKAVLRWKNSQTYRSKNDTSLPTLSDEDNYGRLHSRFIGTDESRIRVRWNKRTDLPLTITLNGVAMATITEEDDGTYAITSAYETATVYKGNGDEKKRVIDVVYPETLGEGDVIAWYSDDDAASDSDGDGSNLDGFLYEHELIDSSEDDGTTESVWYNAGGRFHVRVPIGQSIMDGDISEDMAEQTVSLSILVGTEDTQQVEGSYTFDGYITDDGHWRFDETEEDEDDGDTSGGGSSSGGAGGTIGGTTCETDGTDDSNDD